MTLDIRPIIDGLPFSAAMTNFFETAIVKHRIFSNQWVIASLLRKEQRAIGLLDSTEHRITEKMSKQQTADAVTHHN